MSKSQENTRDSTVFASASSVALSGKFCYTFSCQSLASMTCIICFLGGMQLICLGVIGQEETYDISNCTCL